MQLQPAFLLLLWTTAASEAANAPSRRRLPKNEQWEQQRGTENLVTLTGNNCTQTVTLTPPFYEVQEFRVRQAPGLRCVLTFTVGDSLGGWRPAPYPSARRIGRRSYSSLFTPTTRRDVAPQSARENSLFWPNEEQSPWYQTHDTPWAQKVKPPEIFIIPNAIPVVEKNYLHGFQEKKVSNPVDVWKAPSPSPWGWLGWGWAPYSPTAPWTPPPPPPPPRRPPRLLLQLKNVDLTPGVFTCEFGGARVYSLNAGLPTLLLTVCGSDNMSSAVLPDGGIAVLTYTSSPEVVKGSGFTVSVQSIR